MFCAPQKKIVIDLSSYETTVGRPFFEIKEHPKGQGNDDSSWATCAYNLRCLAETFEQARDQKKWALPSREEAPSVSAEASSDTNSGKEPASVHQYARNVDKSVTSWNLRLGHAIPVSVVKRHVQSGILPHVKCRSHDCNVCLNGNFCRHVRGFLTNVDQIETLHVCTKSILETWSVNCHIYFVTIVKEDSRFLAVKYICAKGEEATEVLRLIKYHEKIASHTVYKIHNGGT